MQSEDNKKYRNSWREKWNLVKEEICEGFECVLLDELKTTGEASDVN